MIQNASNNLIGGSKLPDMSNTILDWFQDVVFGVVRESVVKFEKKIEIEQVSTKAVVQPAGQETLALLSEGDRSWDVEEIHALPDLQLKNGDFVYWNNVKYKVLSKQDYSRYGYMFYVVREAFEG